MEMVLFIGVQGSGKSSFYKQRFYATHVRINRDMLKTRRREHLLVDACLRGKQPFVVDNTNVTRPVRAEYIALARQFQFRVVGYFFETDLKSALERNEQRSGPARIPKVGVIATFKRLEPPQLSEGFDTLFRVHLGSDGAFREIPVLKEDAHAPPEAEDSPAPAPRQNETLQESE
jgi:predicted kinase